MPPHSLKKYKEAFVGCGCLFMAAALVQLAVGDFDNSFLKYPWGVVLSLAYIYGIACLHYFSERHAFLRRLYDHPACVAALTALLGLVLAFGLIRQDGSGDGLAGMLGLTRMTQSWVFVTALFSFTTILGLALVGQLVHLNKNRWASALCHLCVFVVLVAGLFGSADKERVVVHAVAGEPVHTGVAAGTAYHLPFVLTLQEFVLEAYPPTVCLWDRQQDVLGEGLAVDRRTGRLGDWQVELVEVLDMAMPDSASFKPLKHVGAVPAVRVRAMRGSEQHEGWVSCGSFVVRPVVLELDARYALCMPVPTAKNYLSRIRVTDGRGGERVAEVAVNHPARVDGWRIYQQGYDTERGRWSAYSILECVRDPWGIAVHAALWGLCLAACLVFAGVVRDRLVRKKGEGVA